MTSVNLSGADLSETDLSGVNFFQLQSFQRKIIENYQMI